MSYCLFSLDLYQRDAGLALVPTSWCEDLSVFLKSCKGGKNALVIRAGVIWVLWKTRNDHVLDNKIVPTPMVAIHKVVLTLKQWSPARW